MQIQQHERDARKWQEEKLRLEGCPETQMQQLKDAEASPMHPTISPMSRDAGRERAGNWLLASDDDNDDDATPADTISQVILLLCSLPDAACHSQHL